MKRYWHVKCRNLNNSPIVGVDFKTKNMMIDGNVCTIEIWDTAGQEKWVLQICFMITNLIREFQFPALSSGKS